MIRLVVVGAAGRMGRAIEAAAQGAGDVEIAARVDVAGSIPAGPGVWTDDLASVLQPGVVAIEFTGPAGAVAAAKACATRGVPLVSGATGLTPADDEALHVAAARIAILRASNFSLGVAALRRALAAALASVPGSWDVEIVERHHRMKKDSPSGTAATLAADVAVARALAPAVVRCGREGVVGARPAGEIGMHSVRGGTWVGDHLVLLAGEGESLELRHVVSERAAFAHGALAAARFVAAAPAGFYGIDAVLGRSG